MIEAKVGMVLVYFRVAKERNYPVPISLSYIARFSTTAETQLDEKNKKEIKKEIKKSLISVFWVLFSLRKNVPTKMRIM